MKAKEMDESAIDRFKAILDERGCYYDLVPGCDGEQVELQVFGQRMAVTNANPINDPTHTRLVAHIMSPLPETLMMMLDRMCGKTEYRTGPDARIHAQVAYNNDDLYWTYWSHTFPCGHVIEVDGPDCMKQPEVCPICGRTKEDE